MTRILVVDDSALARRVIVRHLEGEGHELVEAADGASALRDCDAVTPDVVLLDVEMPGMDGHETLRRLRAHPTAHDVPVIFLTGRTGADDVAEGLRLGAHDYVRKPFEAIELLARVRAAVRLRELQVALRARNEELERIAAVDALTGLRNRRALEEEGVRIASRLRRHGGPMAVALLDVDAFKVVNDTHGHAVGDAVLVEVARRLGGQLRHEDLVGRWGGEEFVVLAAELDEEGIALVSERMRAAVASSPILVEELELRVTVSAGWAVGRDGAALDVLLREADRALYAAKAEGRNRVRGGS